MKSKEFRVPQAMYAGSIRQEPGEEGGGGNPALTWEYNSRAPYPIKVARATSCKQSGN